MPVMDVEQAQGQAPYRYGTGQVNLSHESAALADRLRGSTVLVRGRGPGGGSGVIWRSSGMIITNAHVARGSPCFVQISDGREFEAQVEARDPGRDLARLAIKADGLVAAPIGDSDALRVGELVVAVGNPLGLVGAVSTGIIHALPTVNLTEPGAWLQADIRLAPGNSGGPLADVFGRVVGINSMVAGGLALAVPSNQVQDFVEGALDRPSLGITVKPVLIPLGERQLHGLLVLEVEARSPAEKGGLSRGDVVVGVGGRPVEGPYDLARTLRRAGRGGDFGWLSLDFLRSGRFETREVFLGRKVRVA